MEIKHKSITPRPAPSMAQGGLVVGAKKTAYNRTVYAAPAVAGLVFRSLGHSAALHSHAHSRHIFAVAGNLRFPLSQPQKRHIQPERYVQ
jgi:hypothetical protein